MDFSTKKLFTIFLIKKLLTKDHCSHLEIKIKETTQRAIDQAELDSLGASLGGEGDEVLGKKKRKKGKALILSLMSMLYK